MTSPRDRRLTDERLAAERVTRLRDALNDVAVAAKRAADTVVPTGRPSDTARKLQRLAFALKKSADALAELFGDSTDGES